MLTEIKTADLIAELVKRTKSPLPDRVGVLVAALFGIDAHQLHMDSRARSISYPRQVAMSVMRSHGMTLMDIGEYYGRDHASVVHAVKAVRSNPKLKSAYDAIMETMTAAESGTIDGEESTVLYLSENIEAEVEDGA